MKYLKSIYESLKGRKLNTYNFGSKSMDDVDKISKQDVSGSLLHWRRVYPDHIKDMNKNGIDAIMYQFAWDQKKVRKINHEHPNSRKKDYMDYPDFNYDTSAMACNLSISPSWDHRNSQKNKYGIHIYFDSFDDDIMYEGWNYFDTFEETKKHAEIVKREFESAFNQAYRNRESIYKATLPSMEKLFDIR